MIRPPFLKTGAIFLNYFDASVSVQLSFINQGARKEKAQAAIEIPAQDDAF